MAFFVGCLADIKTWFSRDLGRFAGWHSEVLVHRDTPEELFFSLYTDTNRYSFRANQKTPDGYLGCVAETRKPRAGETWNRGRDLHDGPLVEATWLKILGEIVSYELTKVHKQNPQPGVSIVTPPALGLSQGEALSAA